MIVVLILSFIGSILAKSTYEGCEFFLHLDCVRINQPYFNGEIMSENRRVILVDEDIPFLTKCRLACEWILAFVIGAIPILAVIMLIAMFFAI